jgi:hypothetical protein
VGQICVSALVDYVIYANYWYYIETNKVEYDDYEIWNAYTWSNKVLSRVLVTNNAGSGLDERVYLLLIHTASNYT